MLDATRNDARSQPHRGPWALVSRRVVTREGTRAAAILISGETVLDVIDRSHLASGCAVEDVGELAVLPGMVDTHVHINEPGRTDWEGFETATRAAAAGGITTLVDMPLNSSPATTTAGAFAQKLEAARGKLWVDCGFYGGLVAGVAGHIAPLISAGVFGFKAFLCYSGIDEFPNVTEADLRRTMPELSASGLPLLVHAELTGDSPIAAPTSLTQCQSYARHLASRPREWEHAAIQLMIKLCREFRCRVHIVHLSSADSLEMIARAREEGLPLTVETCPHYLMFAAEEIPDADPRYKCAPPIRERENRERLWEGLRQGLIDTIGSDHSPAPPKLKQLDTGDVFRAWGGIASLQLSLSALWTAARRRGFALDDLARWMALRPAELIGLTTRKGAIAPGRDADFVVFDPDKSFTANPLTLHHRHPVTPYQGKLLDGHVEATYLRGRLVYSQSTFADSASGQPLLATLAGTTGAA